ncbi:MAG: hypothetical protein JNJ88_13165 [Planctomycetes bacterium]|nr:hypothetical protein [Planctomycetota bacterium]
MSASASRSWSEWADRAALAGLAVGVALMLQPWWAAGFRFGFFVVAAFTVVHMVTSHLPRRSAS